MPPSDSHHAVPLVSVLPGMQGHPTGTQPTGMLQGAKVLSVLGGREQVTSYHSPKRLFLHPSPNLFPLKGTCNTCLGMASVRALMERLELEWDSQEPQHFLEFVLFQFT